MPRTQLRLTPHGHLSIENADNAPIVDEEVAARLADAFKRGPGFGLLQLGAGEVGVALPPAFVWWRDLAARYVGAVCHHASGAAWESPIDAIPPTVPPPTEGELATLALTAPIMPGRGIPKPRCPAGAVG